MTIEVKMNDDYTMEINGVRVNTIIFEQEKSDYILIERSEQIDNLISWISECGYGREGDKFLMKEDLEYLMNLQDEYIFSNIGTNEYIANSDDPTKFYDICKDLLEQSGLTQAEIEDLLLENSSKDETRISLLGHKIKILPSINSLIRVAYDDVIDCINKSVLDGNDGGTIESFCAKYEWNFIIEEDNILYGSFYLYNGIVQQVIAFKTKKEAQTNVMEMANAHSFVDEEDNEIVFKIFDKVEEFMLNNTTKHNIFIKEIKIENGVGQYV